MNRKTKVFLRKTNKPTTKYDYFQIESNNLQTDNSWKQFLDDSINQKNLDLE